MANLLHQTPFKSPNPKVASFTVTIPATSAGSTLICVAGGGAITTAKLGVGGPTFTKRTQSLNFREVAAQDTVDSSGGTTSIPLTLNSADNVNGIIFEFASGSIGGFMAGATESGSGGSVNILGSGSVILGNVTTSGPAVFLSMFTVGDTLANMTQPQRGFWGLGPLGKQFENEGIATDTTGTLYWSLIGMSDQAAAGTFQAATANYRNGTGIQGAAWAYSDTDPSTPSYPNPYPNPVAAENSLPGTLATYWLGSSCSPNISGYTDSMSYDPGSTVNFKVFSNNVGFNVEIYRFGYYNNVLFGARQLSIINGTPAVQPTPTINAYGGTVCSWSTTASWTIPATAVPGIYYYVLRRTDNSSYYSTSIFVVRSSVPSVKSSDVMLTTADFTWQAYNPWGATTDGGGGYGGFTGRDVYSQAPNGPDTGSLSGRAFAVSYDRPFGTVSANAETFFWDSEAGLVNFLEGNGYNIGYYSMVDLQRNPGIPSQYSGAISSGHSEYWSSNLRDAYENARDNGTNLLFFSSNTSLWHTRFDPADTNLRTMICYKDSHSNVGWDGSTMFDPVSYTGSWRDPRMVPGGVNNTERRPESAMTGMWFIGNGSPSGGIAIPDTYKNLPIWRNTRVTTNPGIALRGTNSVALTVPAAGITINQPANTVIGDLVVISIVCNGPPSGLNLNGLQLVTRQSYDTTNLTLLVCYTYASSAGSIGYGINWSNGGGLMPSAVCCVYSGAVWEDITMTVTPDTSGGATHSTVPTTSASTNRWAVAVFADETSANATATTNWTPGSGLTARAQANNAAAAAGNWTSIALMDSNGAVTQGSHQYNATAQFANTNAAVALFYISPGTALYPGSIGGEWDYVKPEEPSTSNNMIMLSKQVIQLAGNRSDYYGHLYGLSGLVFYGIGMYKAPSGAAVFNTGSWRFPFGISRFRNSGADINNSVDLAMQQATLNIFTDLGFAPPMLLSQLANNMPTPLVDPRPAVPLSSYGFDVAPATAYQSMFIPSMFPTAAGSFDGGDYTLGTVFTASADGKIYGARWYFPDAMPTKPVVATLYSWTSNAAGSPLASLTFNNCQSGWGQALFASPVSITANTKYVIAVWTADWYGGSTAFFTTASTVNGPLTSPQDSALTHNGKFIFNSGSPAYPTQTFNGGCYFADVLYLGNGTVQPSGWGIPIA